MDNTFWKYHDEQMIKLRKIYNRINSQLKNKLQEYFNRFEITTDNLYSYVPSRIKTQVNSYIEEWKDKGYLKGDFKILANNMYSKINVRYIEILELLIYQAYIEQKEKESSEEELLFFALLSFYYKEGQIEVNKTLPTTKKKKIKDLNNDLFLLILATPNALGYIYKDYKELTTKYNAQQIARQAVINITQGKPLKIDSNEFENIIQKQQNAKININGDKISGAVDNTLIGMNNQAKMMGITATAVQPDAQVRFIAVRDEKTTDMCESLDNQIFNVRDWNEFKRYSASQGRIVKYRCKGLVIGLNLPPVNDNFHYCRSTIIYVANNKETSYNENGLDIPRINKTVNGIISNYKLNNKVKKLFNKYLIDENVYIDFNAKKPMYYNSDIDKIIINPNHIYFKEYDMAESLSHEIIHLIDKRNNITDNLDIENEIRRSEHYINVNSDKYVEMFKENKYFNNMTLGDIFSSLTYDNISGRFGHDYDYWYDNFNVKSELSANIMSAYLNFNKDTLDVINEITSLKDMKEKVIKKYEKFI